MEKNTKQEQTERLTQKQTDVLEKLEKAMPYLTDFQLGQLDMLAQIASAGGDLVCRQ